MKSETAPGLNSCSILLILAVLLVEFAVLAAAVQNEITLSGNESSRFATVQSLVEKGTFAIEGSQFPTVDRVKIRGRFYSNKPLLFSVFLSGLYAPLHWIGGLRFSVDRNVLISLLTVLGVVPFSLLLTCPFPAAAVQRRHVLPDGPDLRSGGGVHHLDLQLRHLPEQTIRRLRPWYFFF